MINPHEIIDKEFKKQLNGYSVKEVDEFLDEIVVEVQQAYKEVNSLKAKIELQNEKIERYAALEKSIQDTLVLAQSTSETIKTQAKKEAEMILEKAHESVRNMDMSSHAEHAEIATKLQKSRLEFENYRRRVLTFMESQMLSFDAMTKDLGVGNSLTSLNASSVQDLGDTYDFTEQSPLG